MKLTKTVRSINGTFTCPYCGQTVSANVMQSGGCDHLQYRSSNGSALFAKSDKEEKKE